MMGTEYASREDCDCVDDEIETVDIYTDVSIKKREFNEQFEQIDDIGLDNK